MTEFFFSESQNELIKESPIAMAIYEKIGNKVKVIVISDQLSKLIGLSYEDTISYLESFGYHRYTHPDDIKILRNFRQKLVADKIRSSVIYRSHTEQDSTNWHNVYSIGEYRRTSDNRDFFVVWFTDIDELIKLQKNDLNYFLDDVSGNNLDIAEQGARGYFIWNLSKNTPCFKCLGVRKKNSIGTYEEYFGYILSLLESSVEKEKLRELTRENLLKNYNDELFRKSYDFTFHFDTGWVNIHTKFLFFKDVTSNDIYLKLVYENTTSQAAYGNLLSTMSEKMFTWLIYIDGLASRYLVINNDGEHSGERSEKSFRDSVEELCERLCLPKEAPNEHLENLEQKCAKTGICTYISKSESGRHFSITVRCLAPGKKQFFISISNVSQFENLIQSVYYDELTGLPNMMYFLAQAESSAEKLRYLNETPIILYFNLGCIKLYNSIYGFEEGNRFLKEVAQNLRDEFSEDLVSRFTDDRFVVLTKQSGYVDKCKKIHDKVLTIGKGYSLEVNVGVYVVQDGEEFGSACDKANMACDYVKKHADMYIYEYSSKFEEFNALGNYVIDHLNEALKNHYIKAYFQPVIRTVSKKLCGFEALARWIDPEKGFMNPGVFISALEDSHQIHKLDLHIVSEICRILKERIATGNPVVPVSFNLSRLDFQLCDIYSEVEKIVSENDIPREMFHVEVTESIYVDGETVIGALQKFKSKGYQIWLDDFGSGYSSLNVLKDYEYDELKIDMLFLSKLDERAKAIITSTVTMAKHIGIQTLAEGVETEEQFEFLSSIGCEKIQGYYFGRPLPVDQSFEQISDKNLEIETMEEQPYYDTVGDIDLLRESAVSVVEYDGEQLRYLFASQNFRKVAVDLSAVSLVYSPELLNRPNNRVGKNMRECCMLTKKKGLGQKFVIHFVRNEKMAICTFSYIANYKNKDAFACDVQLVQDSVSLHGVYAFNQSLNLVYDMFQKVMTLNVANDSYVVDYRNRTTVMDETQLSLKQFIIDAAQKVIHPDDCSRYLDFMDISKWESRTLKSADRSIRDFFRIKQIDGIYEWRSFGISNSGDNNRYLHNVEYLHSDILEEMLNEKYASVEKCQNDKGLEG